MREFAAIKEPRSRKCPYPLDELLLVALCGITCGADDWVGVARWGRMKQDWLRRFLPFANGVASHDTFSRVFSLLDAAGFEACFIAWMRHLCPTLAGQLIPIDGKSLRGSHDGAAAMTHLVSAWHSGAGVVLGQVATEAKSNEITAIPALIQAMDVQGATITMDAMGCQRDIIKQLVQKQAHSIVAVKSNQPNLAQAIEKLFADTQAGVREGRLTEAITQDKDHGRLETRRCVAASDLSALGAPHLKAWPGLKSVVMIESTREFINGKEQGKSTQEWRYYMSSLDCGAAEFNRKVRGHWAIENSCHWVLDMSFSEDASRIRVGDGAENFAILRRIGLNLIKQDKSSKSSFRIKRMEAAWSTWVFRRIVTGHSGLS